MPTDIQNVEVDVVIVGSGPGGYVAAIRAAQLGLKTAIVEREQLGGICLNWGCIPTKALLRSAEAYDILKHADDFGLSAKDISFDLAAIVKRSRGVSEKLSGGIKQLLKKNKVAVFEGTAKLNGKGKVKVEKDGHKTADIVAKHIIIATGARARVLPGFEPDGKLIWSYREALVPDTMPKSLLVIGSGAIGIEFASFFTTLGAKVTVVDMAERIMSAEDPEIAEFARKQFEKQGMTILPKTTVDLVKKEKNNITVVLKTGDQKQEQTFDRVIVAVGVVGNTENLGFEGTKVKIERGQIVVNEWLETDEKGIYAIGDVVSPPWLAHKASHEGVVCVEKIAGVADVHPIKRLNIPGCTYCHPQVASVGLTEPQAKEKGYDIKVGRFPFMGNGKAIALGDTAGFVKVIFDKKTGELLGAHMVGPEVTEMIQGYVIAKTAELTENELKHTIFAHPTLSEMMHEAVLDADGQVIHM